MHIWDWKRIGGGPFQDSPQFVYFGKLDTPILPFLVTPTGNVVKTVVPFELPGVLRPQIRGLAKKDHALDKPKLLNPCTLNFLNSALP